MYYKGMPVVVVATGEPGRVVRIVPGKQLLIVRTQAREYALRSDEVLAIDDLEYRNLLERQGVIRDA